MALSLAAMGELPDSGGPNVQVYCRIRPLLTASEHKAGSIISVLPGQTALQCWENTELTRAKGSPFTFDGVFGPEASQEHVYSAAEPVVRSVLAGYNGTIFAFGQTASGKTFTIQGPDLYDPQQQGIVARTVSSLFASVREAQASWEFTIKVSCVEIYMERIRDLLAPTRNNLPIRQDEVRGIFVDGVQEEYVAAPAELLGVIEEATANRAVSATGMNAGSSRSHSVVTITVEARAKDDPSGGLRVGKLNIVDLAGSESLRRSAATGQTAAEAMVINTSLSALGNVIYALSSRGGGGGCGGARSIAMRDQGDSGSVMSRATRRASGAASASGQDNWDTSSVVSSSAASTTSRRTVSSSSKPRHVPYRDSKLTRLLQESLGGNSRTVLIVCVSPTQINVSETMSTLRFGVRTKRIKNTVHVNTRRTPEEMQALLQKAESAIDAQQGLIMALKEQIRVLKTSSGPSSQQGDSSSDDDSDDSSQGRQYRAAHAQGAGRQRSRCSDSSDTDGSSQASCITDMSYRRGSRPHSPGTQPGAASTMRSHRGTHDHASAQASNAMELVLMREQLSKQTAAMADLQAQLNEKQDEVASLSAALAASEATVQQLHAASSTAQAAAAQAAAVNAGASLVGDGAALTGASSGAPHSPGAGPTASCVSAQSGDPSLSFARLHLGGDATTSLAGTSLVLDSDTALLGGAEAGVAALTYELTSVREEAHSAREQARARARDVVELQGQLDAAREQASRQVAGLRQQLSTAQRALLKRRTGAAPTSAPSATRALGSTAASSHHSGSRVAAGWVDESDSDSVQSEAQTTIPAQTSSAESEAVLPGQHSTLANTQHQLQQIMITHRQLQRKYAVMEQEYGDMLASLRGRDNRLKRALAANSGQHLALRQLRTSHAEQEVQIRWLRGQLQQLGELQVGDADSLADRPAPDAAAAGHSKGHSNIIRPVRGGVDTS